MKAGIISEFNPFHFGHDYLVKKIKKEYNPEVIITLMSGDFTMRGEVAIFSKWERCRMALESGIDLVIENPVINTVESSEGYAYNAIKVLEKAGVTDLFFSKETTDIDELHKMIRIRESSEFNERFSYHFNEEGLSYSKSLTKSFKDLNEDVDESFFLPNNILSFEYIRAIEKANSKIIPHVFKRIDTFYYDEIKSDTLIQSATAIREELKNGTGLKYLPYPNKTINPVFTSNIFEMVYGIIKRSSLEELKSIKGVTEGMEHKLKNLNGIKSYDELVSALLSKRNRESKIKRMLIYILLNIKKEYSAEEIKSFRILGFTKAGSNHLKSLKSGDYDFYTKLRKDHPAYVRREMAYSEIYEIIAKSYSLTPLSPLKK